MNVDLVNLYPDSETFVNDDKPRNSILVLSDLNRYVEELEAGRPSSGPQGEMWTIEVLTKTPFGIERLAFVEFALGEGLKVRGGIHTLD